VERKARAAWNFATFLVVCFPALAIYVATLGAIEINVYNRFNYPVISIPGWSRNELYWHIPAWVPFA
jgi:hypothetical protein